ANQNKNDPVVAKAATIEVTPEQAQKLALAAEVGTLSMALRGTIDPLATPGETAALTTRISDLRLEGARPAAPMAVRNLRRAPRREGLAAPTIEIIRGSE